MAQQTHLKPTMKSTTYQYSFGVSAGLAGMTAGAWLAWPSTAINPLREEFNLSTVEVSVLVALMDFGNVLSPIPASYSMDTIGRKLTLFTTAIIYIIASICSLVATNVWWLYMGRIFAGLGKGVAFAVIPIYLAEISNVENRGGLSTMFIGFLNIGMLFDYLIGPFVELWILNVLNLIIPTIFILTFFLFPESPYYLLMKGREGSAKNSLIKYRQIKKCNAGKDSILENELKNMQKNVENDMKNRGRFIDLFLTSGNRKALLIISALALFQRSSGISPTLAYSTSIMPKDGGGLSSNVYMIAFSAILVIATYLATPLVDSLGRKPLLMISSITTALTTAIAGVYYYLERSTNFDIANIKWIPYACLIIFAITYSIGIGFLPSTLVGELFPTNVKSYAGSVSAIILAATSFIVNNIFYNVAEAWGPHIMYWVFTLACILCALFTQFIVFETKGKSFAEIQTILNKPS